MAITRYYTDALPGVTLEENITSTTNPIIMSSSAGVPQVPFTFALDYNNGSQEVFLATDIIRTSWAVTRAFDGGTAQSHNSGVAAVLVVSVTDYSDANAHHTDATRDDHAQYYNNARHESTVLHEGVDVGGNIPVGIPSTSNIGDVASDPGAVASGGYADMLHVHGRETLATLRQLCWPTGGIGFFLSAMALPTGFLPAQGQAIQVQGAPELYGIMGFAYGGSSNYFVQQNNAWANSPTAEPPSGTTFYFNLPNINNPAPSIQAGVKVDPGYVYVPAQAAPPPPPVPPPPPAGSFPKYPPPNTPSPPVVNQPLFVGPGFVTTIIEYDEGPPVTPYPPHTQVPVLLFGGAPMAPAGASPISWIYLQPGQAFY